jgi:hypothetical protein
MREERWLLMDDGNAERVSGGRIDSLVRARTDGQKPAIRGFCASHDLDEGGLAGAVFANQGMNFAGVDVERHPSEGDHAREGLRNGISREQDAGHEWPFITGLAETRKS